MTRRDTWTRVINNPFSPALISAESLIGTLFRYSLILSVALWGDFSDANFLNEKRTPSSPHDRIIGRERRIETEDAVTGRGFTRGPVLSCKVKDKGENAISLSFLISRIISHLLRRPIELFPVHSPTGIFLFKVLPKLLETMCHKEYLMFC